MSAHIFWMKLTSLSLLAASMCFGVMSFAQDVPSNTEMSLNAEMPLHTDADTPSSMTPREKIVAALSKDRGATPPAPTIEVETESVPVVEESIEERVETSPSGIAFYATAQEYLKTRGGGEAPQLTLIYEINTYGHGDQNQTTAKNQIAAQTNNVNIVLGADYAALIYEDRGREGAHDSIIKKAATPKITYTTKIYDFKLNRLLTIRPQMSVDGRATGREQFDNVSLFPGVYRNIKTVRRMTRNGSVREIQLGQKRDQTGAPQTLDAFWVESAMSWMAAEAKISLETVAETTDAGAKLNIIRGKDTVFSAAFAKKDYQAEGFKQSLLALAHHEWPLHPRVLQNLYDFDAPMSKFKILSYSPKAPNGDVQVWTLKARDMQTAGFPLPVKALSVTERQPTMPLTVIISEAVQGKARGGMQSADSIEKEFYAHLQEDVPLTSWLLGQKYRAYTGGCGNRESAGEVGKDGAKLCGHLSKIENAGAFDKTDKLHHYIQSRNWAQSKASRVQAVKIVKPYLDDPETPAIVLRTAAMARAKLKTGAAKAAGLENVRAETLLKAALAKDPYDPNTYVGLAQVYAANGALEHSWDIYDALRTGIPTVGAVALKIDAVENKIRRTAPGYFLSSDIEKHGKAQKGSTKP